MLLASFYSCKKDKKAEEVTIRLNTYGKSFVCGGDGEYCGNRIYIVGRDGFFKATREIPDSIITKTEFWKKDYLASVKFLKERCSCSDGRIDPLPGKKQPEEELGTIEILKIREK